MSVALHPFNRFNSVIINQSAKRDFKDAWMNSVKGGREIGGISCYDDDGKTVTLKNFIPLGQWMPMKNAFQYDDTMAKQNSKFLCSKERTIFVHTHPSGNADASDQDRYLFDKKGLLGCTVGGNSVKCFAGYKELPTTSSVSW